VFSKGYVFVDRPCRQDERLILRCERKRASKDEPLEANDPATAPESMDVVLELPTTVRQVHNIWKSHDSFQARLSG
jgi:hypothetical protein